jgi:hypothetical protein
MMSMILTIIFAVLALLLGYFAAKPKHLLALASSDLDLEPEAQGQLEATMRWMLAATAVVCLGITSYVGYFGKPNAAELEAEQRQNEMREERMAKIKKYGARSLSTAERGVRDK